MPQLQEVLEIVRLGPSLTWSSRLDANHKFLPLPNHSIHTRAQNDSWEVHRVLSGLVLGGTLFGGLHCLAWNFQFPTPGETIAWRVSAVLITVTPVFLALFFTLDIDSDMESIVSATVFLIGIFAYVLARLSIIVEVFRTLLYLPPDAFIETWSGSFPHFG